MTLNTSGIAQLQYPPSAITTPIISQTNGRLSHPPLNHVGNITNCTHCQILEPSKLSATLWKFRLLGRLGFHIDSNDIKSWSFSNLHGTVGCVCYCAYNYACCVPCGAGLTTTLTRMQPRVPVVPDFRGPKLTVFSTRICKRKRNCMRKLKQKVGWNC